MLYLLQKKSTPELLKISIYFKLLNNKALITTAINVVKLAEQSKIVYLL